MKLVDRLCEEINDFKLRIDVHNISDEQIEELSKILAPRIVGRMHVEFCNDGVPDYARYIKRYKDDYPWFGVHNEYGITMWCVSPSEEDVDEISLQDFFDAAKVEVDDDSGFENVFD